MVSKNRTDFKIKFLKSARKALSLGLIDNTLFLTSSQWKASQKKREKTDRETEQEIETKKDSAIENKTEWTWVNLFIAMRELGLVSDQGTSKGDYQDSSTAN